MLLMFHEGKRMLNMQEWKKNSRRKAYVLSKDNDESVGKVCYLPWHMAMFL